MTPTKSRSWTPSLSTLHDSFEPGEGLGGGLEGVWAVGEGLGDELEGVRGVGEGFGGGGLGDDDVDRTDGGDGGDGRDG